MESNLKTSVIESRQRANSNGNFKSSVSAFYRKIPVQMSRRSFLKSTTRFFSAYLFYSSLSGSVKAQTRDANTVYRQLDPEVPYSPGYVSIFSDLQKIEEPFQGRNPWLNAVEGLEAELINLHEKNNLTRAGISIPLNTTRNVLGLASATAVPPASYVTLALKKHLDFQTKLVLSSIDKNLQSNISNLSTLALGEVTNKRGIPFEALFPSGNPKLAVQNIKEAVALLLAKDSKASEPVKQAVSEALLQSLLAMYEEGFIAAEINPATNSSTSGKVSEFIEQFHKNSEILSEVTEERIAILEKGDALARINAEALQEFVRRAQVSSSTRQQIHDAASSFKEVLTTVSAVTGAMTALGMSPENTAVVQKATSILSSSIDVVLSLTASTINPLTAISSIAGLVTSIFGSSRSQPDPVFEYLKHIDKKLE